MNASAPFELLVAQAGRTKRGVCRGQGVSEGAARAASVPFSLLFDFMNENCEGETRLGSVWLGFLGFESEFAVVVAPLYLHVCMCMCGMWHVASRTRTH